MYVDDEIALTVRDMAISKADMDIAKKTYDTCREEVVKYMREHGFTHMSTDEYTVTLTDRSTITIDRKELEEREPELFREISEIHINTVVKITPR